MGNDKSSHRAELDDLVAKLQAGELAPSGKSRLGQLLSRHPECLERFLGHMYLDSLLHEGPMVVDAVEIRPNRRGRLALGLGAIAAAIVAALFFSRFVESPPAGTPVAQIQRVVGEVVVESPAGRKIAGSPGQELRAGSVIRVHSGNGMAALAYSDSTQLVLMGQGKLKMIASRPQKEAVVENGTVFGNVATPLRAKPLLLKTPNAELAIAGNRFAVEAAEGSTRAHAIAGDVRVKRLSDGRTLDMTAGQWLALREGEPSSLVAKSSDYPAEWHVDFEEGLSGWKIGEPVNDGLPADRTGAVRQGANPSNPERFATGTWDNFRGLFEAFDDTHIRITYKMERPDWVNVFLIAQPPDWDGSSGWPLYKYVLWQPATTAARWYEVTIPLAAFEGKEPGGRFVRSPPMPGNVIKHFFLTNVGNDRGLVVDEVIAERGGPGTVSFTEIE